jgi:TorA maturation chaperone TorD
MSTALAGAEVSATDLARECLYRFLAATLTDPAADGWGLLLDPDSRRLAAEAAVLLRDEAAAEPAPLGFGELPPDDLDLGPLLAELDRTRPKQTAEYDRVFGLIPARECLPYETEYHATAEPFFRAQQLADVAGFYRAFGLEPARDVPERPDHLALELEFMAFLLMKKRLASAAAGGDNEGAERARVCAEAEAAFIRDHLAWWVPSFAAGLRRKASQGFYAALGRVLAALMPLERRRLGVPPPRVPLQAMSPEPPEEQAGCGGCAP